MGRARWARRSVAAPLTVSGLLLAATGFCLGGVGISRLVHIAEAFFMDGVVLVPDAGVWPDRRGEPWYCSSAFINCPPWPTRPAEPTDEPVWIFHSQTLCES